MRAPILLTGNCLSPELVRAIARDGAEVRVADEAAVRITAANEVVLRAARSGIPVYGVTTGLAPRVPDSAADGGTEFSLRPIRGGATAVGEPLSVELTRATLAVRCNGICAGGSGAAPAGAQLLGGEVQQGR